MEPLTTARLTVRNFSPQDWRDLHEMITLYAASEYAPYDGQWPTSEEEIQGVAAWFAKEDRYLAASLRSSGKVIGFVALGEERAQACRTYGLGYVFHAGYYGQGYATEACQAVIDRAFGALGAERIVCSTAAINAPSRRLLRRLDLSETGRGTGSFREDAEGSPITFESVTYALEREAWEARQGHREGPV